MVRGRSSAYLIGATLVLSPVTSVAQTAVATDLPASANAAPSASAGVEDIVVTATRRSVNLQEVPATIEAVTGTTLRAFNITGVNQLVTLTSGLVSAPSGGNNLFLRGIGAPSTGYNEAQVAVYIDGLYLANPAVGIFSFNNIERIEVLKGPQGTLYGRNVTGGLISVITNDPAPERRLDASVGYANYETVTANLYASTPITDTLAANVAVFHQKQSLGWSRNVVQGNDVQRTDETGVEAKLKWHPEPRTTVTGSFIYDYNNRDIGSAYQVEPGTLGSDGTPFLGRYRVASHFVPSAPTNIYIGILRAEHDFGFATLSSITGYQASHALVNFTGGQPVLTTSDNIFYEKNKTFSQELQLTSKKTESRFDWVIGAFYYDDHTELRLDTIPYCPNGVCAGPVPTRSDGFPSTRSGSVYGDGTYRFFDATRLTVGLRYTNEDKALTGLLSPLPGFSNSVATLPPSSALSPGAPFVVTIGGVPTLQPGIPTKLNFDRLTYRFVLAQDLGDNVHLYASHNLGFKSGAYNGNLFSNAPVRPELLYASEAGVKSELFDRRLRLNASYFHYTYKDVQARSIAPPAPPGNALLQNAASERIDGIDADFSVVPFRGLTINGTLEHLIARYVDYPGATRVTQGPNRVLPNGVIVGTVVNTTPFNLAGFTPQNAPEFSASIGFVYTYETPVGPFAFSANDHYTSSTSKTNDDSVIDPHHHIVDLSLGWTAANKRYDVSLWVKNLGNEYTYAAGQISNNFVVIPGPPRQFGATVGAHF